jgi:hypothetical protein
VVNAFQDPQWLQIVVGSAEVVILVLALWATVFQFTRIRASSYIERFNSKDMLESRVAVDAWLRDHPTTMARLETLESSPELSVQLKQFANLFQELGAAYEFRIAHRGTVEVLFDTLIVMYWERLEFWIEDYRASYDPTLYARFERLYRRVKRRSRPAAFRRMLRRIWPRSSSGVEDRREPEAGHKTDDVLAYGSLMDPESAESAIGREVERQDFVPVTLVGMARTWSIGEAVRVGPDGLEVTAVFLNVEEVDDEAAAEAAAVMFRVSRRELEELKVREKNYECRDRRPYLRDQWGVPLPEDVAVWCFEGKEDHRVDPSVAEAVILRRYVERVAKAAGAVSPGLPDRIKDSAARSGFRQVPGSYTFVDPQQQSLV